MHSQTRSFRGSPVGIGLAIFATITLILTLASVVRPSPVAAQGEDDAALNIFKLVEGTTTRLPGAVFEVEGLDGTFTSDENGQICITGLPEDAEYLVREIQAPDGYEIIEPEQTVEVDNDGDCDSPDARFYNRPSDEGEAPAETTEVEIMKHLCPEVSTTAEFEAIEAAARDEAGSTGLEENEDFAALAATVVNCPTIILSADVPTDAAPMAQSREFEFTVLDEDGEQVLSTDGAFTDAQLCETDISVDVDNNGSFDADVCLDTSYYGFEVVDGVVTITETDAPGDEAFFGTIRFTPGSGDEEALVGSIGDVEASGVITLDTTLDPDNSGEGTPGAYGSDVIMVHVYNFTPAEGEGGGEEETVSVSIMKHLCADVSTVAEFEAVENAGAGGQPGGIGTISGLVATVLACPTIVLTGDVPTDGAITNGNVDFDFSVVDAGGTRMLSTDGTFEQQALCEDDVMLDADGSGDIEADVCLDTSHYAFEVVDGAVVLTETAGPEGSTGLGTIRFTPGSEDETALATSIDEVEVTGVVTLDTSMASETALADGMLMIHAYNFANDGEGTAPTGEGTLGGNPPGAGSLPDTATPSVTESLPATLLALLVIAGLGWTVRVNLAAVRSRSH